MNWTHGCTQREEGTRVGLVRRIKNRRINKVRGRMTVKRERRLVIVHGPYGKEGRQ